ncbi:MAG: M3 family oligoendopeptidase, partial [Candidatus Dojkabacteria bacterium]
MSPKFKWNLEALYKDIHDSKIEEDKQKYQVVIESFSKKWSEDQQYLSSEEKLKEALDEYNLIIEDYAYGGKPGIYIFLQSSLHEDNDEIRGVYGKYVNFIQENSNKILFFTNRLAKVDKKQQEVFLNSKLLSIYHTLLRRLFDKSKHILSEPEEKILNLTSKPSYSNWIDMTSSLLTKSSGVIINEEGKKEKKTFMELASLVDSNNEKTRMSAAKEFSRINEQYAEIATFEINSIFEAKKVEDKLRGFTRPDESSIVGDDVTLEFVDNLIEGVSNGFNIPQRFYELKAKLLKKDKLKYFERNLSIGNNEKTYTSEEAVELVSKVLGDLDHSFSDFFDEMLEDGNVDFFPSIGKSGGAFCMSSFKSGPIYVLLNHTNRLQDVLTFAHEMGHAIHYKYAKKQIGTYFGASLATAEVASTFMEDFVLEELVKEANDEQKLSIIMMKLNDDVSTIFRQVACYKFEKDLHDAFAKSGFLSKDDIGAIFKKNMTAYIGSSVDFEKTNENWWVYWSHIRRFFYVYSYASGLLISKALQHEYKQDKKFIEKVKSFFAAGDSDSPDEIFKSIGIDTSSIEF